MWCGDAALKYRFSRLFANSKQKGANIGEVGEWSRNEWE